MTDQDIASRPAVDGLTPPRTVNIAFWLFIAAAATYIPAFIVGLALTGPERAKLISQGVSTSRAAAAVDFSVGVLVFGVVIGFVLLGLMAVLFRGGARWARTVLIVLTVLTIVSLIPSIASGYGLDVVHAVLMIGGTLYALLPTSSRYLANVKTAVKDGGLR